MKEKNKGRRHIDSMRSLEIHGIFSDDGYEISDEMIKKTPLCLICKKDNDPEEELLCNLNRYDQRNAKEFKCFAFERMESATR